MKFDIEGYDNPFEIEDHPYSPFSAYLDRYDWEEDDDELLDTLPDEEDDDEANYCG